MTNPISLSSSLGDINSLVQYSLGEVQALETVLSEADDSSSDAIKESLGYFESMLTETPGSLKMGQTLAGVSAKLDSISSNSSQSSGSGGIGVRSTLLMAKQMGLDPLLVLQKIIQGGGDIQLSSLEEDVKKLIMSMLKEGIKTLNDLFRLMSLFGLLGDSVTDYMMHRLSQELEIFVDTRVGELENDPKKALAFLDMVMAILASAENVTVDTGVIQAAAATIQTNLDQNQNSSEPSTTGSYKVEDPVQEEVDEVLDIDAVTPEVVQDDKIGAIYNRPQPVAINFNRPEIVTASRYRVEDASGSHFNESGYDESFAYGHTGDDEPDSVVERKKEKKLLLTKEDRQKALEDMFRKKAAEMSLRVIGVLQPLIMDLITKQGHAVQDTIQDFGIS